MPEYVTRNVTVIDFSDLRNIKIPNIYRPQSCVLKLEQDSIDIGSNCYMDREVNKNGAASLVTKNCQGVGVIRVSLDSFDEKRIAMIRQLVEYIAHLAISASQVSLASHLKRLLRFFRFYCTQSDLDYSQPENRAHYEEAARRYSATLNANKKLATSSKSMLSKSAFYFAEFLYDSDELNTFDFDIIQSPRQYTRSTKPMLPEEQELALALRSAVFEGVVDLVINKKTLPYPLTVPVACRELDDIIWLGYKPWRGSAPFPRAKDFEKHQPKEWFNRDLGALVTRVQWAERADHKSINMAHCAWRDIQNGIKTVNLDHSNLKQSLAEYAALCFIDLLLSMTGMNQQPALDLPWFGGYFVQKARQGNKTVLLVSPDDQAELECAKEPNVHLRSIKNRKGYQPVEVTISNRFLPKFKRYLQLREYYLKGVSDVRLFPFKVKIVNRRRLSFHHAFPEIPRLGSRQARANLSDAILTEENDPHIAAQVLQNAPSTIIKHYAAGTQRAHIQGMGGFLNTLDNQIRVTRIATNSCTETAVGSCDQGGTEPDPLPGAPFDLNCSQQEGCFFCKHYSVHADEIDIRKLISVSYYINKGATRASDINFFNDLFDVIIRRINNLLEQMEGISTQKKRLISRIKEEVMTEEALDEYWLCKLNRLESLIGER